MANDNDTTTPARPLGRAGSSLWAAAWSCPWMDPDSDYESVLMLCESMDERQALRLTVLQNGGWRERAALRALDQQIAALMDALGLNPTGRQRLAVQVEESPFDELTRLGITP